MATEPSPRQKIVLIDAMALIHRAFHAIPFLSTRDGELTNAVFGFTSTVLSVLKDLQPDYVAVSFDLPEPTFRHTMSPDYKATRQKAPDELRSQFGRVREVVQTLEMPIFELPGYEADDVIGSLAKQISQQYPVDVYIVTGDRDSLQLVDDHVRIHMLKWRPGGRVTITYDPARLQEDTGMSATEYLEYKALLGDTSDNIPGVPGIGEKTATALVQQYKTLEKLYEILNEAPAEHPLIKPKIRENLCTFKEQAFMSRELSKIVIDLKLDVDLEKCRPHQFDLAKASALFASLEFTSLIPRLKELAGESFGAPSGASKTKASDADAAPAHSASRDWSQKKYQVVADEKSLKELVKKLESVSEFAFDTETRELESIAPNLIGLSFSWERDTGYYIACDHAEGPTIPLDRALEFLKPVLTNPKIGKIAHNLKYDYEAVRCYGIEVAGSVFDTMLGSYILNPGARTLKLDNLAHQELGYEMQPITDLIGTKKADQLSLADLSSEVVANYAAEDADLTWQLYEKLSQNLRDIGLDSVMSEIELPLVPVLAAMEQQGVLLDSNFLASMSGRFAVEIAKLEKAVYQQAGQEFNLNSPAQLSKVLFDDLQIAGEPGTRGGKQRTTAASELEKYRNEHPIVADLIRYREFNKLKSTYIDSLPKLVRADTGRLHTTYSQTVAATGRLSSTDPNLQNIPIRTEIGREIRKAFVTMPGYVLVSADYSQFELRIAAHISGDPKLSQAFRDGLDIHTATAAEIGGVPLDEVKPEQRYAAKAVNFSILYGATSHGLSKSTGMAVKDAQAYIDRYFQTYPNLREYMDAMILKAQTDGYVETLFGRRRYLPEIHASVYPVREAAKRMAINMPIQGTQADILKIAMATIHAELPRVSAEAHLLLTVHDELVLEVPESEAQPVAKWLTAAMENAYPLNVPVKAEAKIGQNWGEMTAAT